MSDYEEALVSYGAPRPQEPTVLGLIFSKELLMELVSWSFTWALALLPILFILCKQHLINGGFSLTLLCSNGELFLVSIVMVAEPLGGIVKNRVKNVVSLLFTLFIITTIITCSYFFCIVEMNEPRMRRCQECEMAAFDQAAYSAEHMDTTAATAKNNVKGTGMSRTDSTFVSNNKSAGLPVKEEDKFLSRVRRDSFVCLALSFLLGMISVIHTHILNEKHEIDIKGAH
jgi:hypothetical protein